MAKNSELDASVGFEALTEAVSAALLRATDSRASGALNHKITAGIWIEPNNPTSTDGDSPKRTTRSLTRSELADLATGQRISRSSVGVLNDSIGRNPALGSSVVVSLAQDLSGTMHELFDLSNEEIERLQIGEREWADLLSGLPGLMNMDIDSVTIEAQKKESEDDKKKGVDFEFEIKTEVGTDGNGKVSAGIKIKW